MGHRERKRYRIDFALITITGNLTRYLTWHPLIDADERVRARWYPIRTWVMDDWLGRVPGLPGQLRVYARHFLDSRRFLFSPLADAAVIQAFETYPLYVVLCRLRFWQRMPVIVWSSDDAMREPAPGWRGWFYRHAVAHTALHAPFSAFAAERIHERYPNVPPERIVRLHPGIDLSLWPLRAPRIPGKRFRLLFVGGETQRKGLTTLLDAMDAGMATHCELDIATQTVHLPEEFRERIERMPSVRLHLDLTPNSPELRRLYVDADALVLPTNFDCSSLVSLEAMATGIPVVASNVGGIPDIIHDDETGLLIPPRDPQALVAAVERLRTDALLRERLVHQARAHVEEHFDATNNTALLITLITALIDGHDMAQVLPDSEGPAAERAHAATQVLTRIAVAVSGGGDPRMTKVEGEARYDNPAEPE